MHSQVKQKWHSLQWLTVIFKTRLWNFNDIFAMFLSHERKRKNHWMDPIYLDTTLECNVKPDSAVIL